MMSLSDLVGGPDPAETQQVLRGRVARAPSTPSDVMEVIVPAFSGELVYEVPASNWIGAVPGEGATCLLLIDNDGDAWVVATAVAHWSISVGTDTPTVESLGPGAIYYQTDDPVNFDGHFAEWVVTSG